MSGISIDLLCLRDSDREESERSGIMSLCVVGLSEADDT